MAWKDETAASEIRRSISNLSVAAEALARGGAFQGVAALTAEDESIVTGYASGAALTNFNNAMAAQRAIAQAIGAGLASAKTALAARLALLEF